MQPRSSSLAILFVFLGTLVGSSVAEAQESPDAGAAPPPGSDAPRGEGGAPPPPPALVPPRLLEFVEATYPVAAREQALEATVELSLTIAVDGTVVEAQVLAPAGNGFDEAALEAARRFRFEPARRNGVPIPARIRYRYVFELSAAEPPPPSTTGTEGGSEGTGATEGAGAGAAEAPAHGRIAGRVLTMEDEAGVGGADVVLTSVETGEERRAVAGDDGSFAFDDLAPGHYTVAVEAAGLGSVSQDEEVAPGQETAVVYRLATTEAPNEPAEAGFSARAVVDPPPREVTRRTLPAEVLTRIPGTRGDPLRAIEILPGVARPPFGFGAIIVRGSAPGDTQVLFGGIPIPLLYHFGGLTSVVQGRLLQRIDFFPGNFSSRYGRKIGGIIEVEARDPATDRFHGMVEFGVIDASILFEGPVTRRFSIAGAVRRSLIDLVFDAFVPKDRISVTAAPVYYDYQLFATWRPTSRDRVRFQFYGASDAFRLILGPGLSDDPSVRGGLGLATRFNHFQATWDRPLGERTEQSITAQVGPQHLEFKLGQDVRFILDSVQMYGRAEWRTRFSSHVRMVYGTDTFVSPFRVRYFGPPPGQSEGNTGTMNNGTAAVNTNGFVVRPGFYTDLALTIDRVLLNLAGRFDYYSEIGRVSFDPRAVIQVRANDHLRLKAGAGLFSQPPEFQESAPSIGNPHLHPIHAVHLGLGGDYTFREGIQIGLEGFYKQLWNRVVSTEDGSAPYFINEGIGRIYGMELSGRLNPPGAPYFGYVSYTLMRSERRDHPDQAWRLFDFDQTHIFTTAFVYHFRRHNWELGGTLRFVTGNPRTPIVGSVFDPIQQTYYPIPGATNSARNPYFNRLDIRVQKQWAFHAWKLTLFLDVQNVYNRHNQEGLIYNYDYTRTSRINGLPIIPALGLRGEF